MEIIVLSLLLLAATIVVHYETLRLVSVRMKRGPGASRSRLFIVLVFALLSHLIHVFLYAIAYQLIARQEGFGSIEGGDGSFADAFYFSITSYTTLGIGDLYPTEAIRLLSGIEALNGLVMVGWTASFTYLTMERFWKLGVEEDE
ncbi:two pore domain potassium channel family protein [Sphingomicrobium sp. B8]|uniref:Two pore domain potassium channel family protein n=1 Tax=Sphingomicrobium clamense TaxID=2851013 RepID=A0ABS6V454_9SPHN|nr:two pore domain potassium channel family protein [Sphingomicrobium sp. B8]